MKIEKVSEHVWSLKSWMIIPVTVWVVVDNSGVTLVDAGMSFMAKGILKFINSLNAGPLQRILLTHGHGDHVGAVQRILAHHPVPVYVHQLERPFMEGDLPYPRRKKSEQSLPKGLAKELGADEDNGLHAVAGLKPYLTPGHSPGHVVYYHEQDQVLLAGDLCTSKNGNLHRPMPLFTADMAEALRSTTLLRDLKPKRLEICHGKPVFNPADQLDAYLQKTAAAFSLGEIVKPV